MLIKEILTPLNLKRKEMSKTAVEWLEIEITKRITRKNPHDIIIIQTQSEILIELFKQAKEMEKQQIMDAFSGGMNDSVDYFIPSLNPNDESENYYNETFKTK